MLVCLCAFLCVFVCGVPVVKALIRLFVCLRVRLRPGCGFDRLIGCA